MKTPDEFLAVYRRMREVERLLDERVEQASRRMDVLEASDNLAEHVRAIMGESLDAEEVQATVDSLAHDAVVQDMLRQIREIREDVSARCGLKKFMDDLRAIPGKIGDLIRLRGYKTGRDYFIQTLSQNLALFAMAFYGRPIIYRTTDFKTNEYYNLLGGNLYEHCEDNPMLGYRGVSRNLHDWELEAFKQARGAYGGHNLQLMLPFVRTLEQARSMRAYLDEMHDLRSGKDDLKIIMMSELPSNAILARQFIQEFDGFSIGSNDMTQMVLATDRDNASLAHIYDEEDPAVIWALLTTIFTGQKYGKKVGFCGQGFANSPIVRGVCAIAGIVSASVVPDTYYQAKLDVAAVEKEGVTVGDLGAWLSGRHMERLHTLLKNKGQAQALKACAAPEDCKAWYERETRRQLHFLQENLGSAREAALRRAAEEFRAVFHKPVIYASWQWNEVVLDALHQAGFASFEEQALALAEQRKSKP
jgi:pyruvate,water dikinase